MFVFSEKLTFWWPVKVIEPDPHNPGEKVEQEFEALFELLDPDEQKAAARERLGIVRKITPDLDDVEVDKVQKELDAHDLKTLRRALKGWRGLGLSETEELPFSDANFRKLYRHHRFRNAFALAYLDATTDDRARLGN